MAGNHLTSQHRSRQARNPLVLGLLIAALMALSCAGGCEAPLAVLQQTAGSVDRDFAAHLNTWETAEVGAEFKVGDGARTGAQSGAVLRLEGGSLAELKENTLVRFLETPPSSKEQGFDILAGEALLSAGNEELKLRTHVGLARIEPGAKVFLRRNDNAVRYQVTVGTARFETNGGVVELGAGQGIEVGIGQAVLERFDDKPEPTAAPKIADDTPSETPDTGAIALNVEGKGAQLKEPGAATFKALEPGSHTLTAGAALNLPRGTQAVLTRAGRSVTLKGQGQFLIAAPGSAFIQTESGDLSVNAESGSVAVIVPGGTITTKAGSVSDIGVRRDGTKISARVGEVELVTANGTEVLRGGEEARLAPSGQVEIGGRGPSYADIILGAGDSIAIHDPSPPTAVGVRFGDRCKEGGVVQLMRGTVVGSSSRSEGGSANILVPAGMHAYRVRCLGAQGLEDQAAATGRIAVRRDSGTAQLPSSAPRTQIDTDGRTYTVLYQNLLPQIAVRWKDPPKASTYKLTVKSGGKTQSLTTATPNYFFGSGALPEGTHHLVFEAGARRSRATPLTISFDNAAPSARITSPEDRSFGPGAGVTVAGIALPGWKVSVSGKELDMDAQNRFTGSVATPGDLRALAIRFAHPQRGVRFYLRRSAQ